LGGGVESKTVSAAHGEGMTLKKTQEWFGSIISRPIDQESRMNPLSPSGVSMEKEACSFLLPSPTLAPHQRIELYNQQYWWRLMRTLQESFPLVTRLFGCREFDRAIAVPYLVKHRPRHWNLNALGDRLVQWIEEEYEGEDKALILDAAKLDFAFEYSFTARHYPTITLEDLSDEERFFETKLFLQPHIALFSLPYDLFTTRHEFILYEPEHWEKSPFPPLAKGNFYYILYRDLRNDISWELLTLEHFQWLARFQKGATLNEIGASEAFLLEELPRWAGLQWLTLDIFSDTPLQSNFPQV
jgi:Putative DNA-binding domain